QALERGRELVEPFGAVVSLPDAAVAHATRVVCGAASGRLLEVRGGGYVLRRARSAVPDLRTPPLTVLRGLRFLATGVLDFPDRKLQLVQSANDAAVSDAVRRRGAADDTAHSSATATATAALFPAADGNGRTQRHRAPDCVLQPGAHGSAVRR